MPDESIELVRELTDAFRREGWTAVLPVMHPEFELVTRPEVAMEPDTYRGEQGLRRYFESFEDAMEDIQLEATGEAVSGDQGVFVPFKLVARGRETGIEAEQHAFQVWTVRDGQVRRIEVFASREMALQAAGLPYDT